MRGHFLICVAFLVLSGVVQAQRSTQVLTCKKATLAALKPKPELSYECDAQLQDWDEKILQLPARLAAIKTLESELASFTDAAWWTADPVDLGVCEFAGTVGTLTRDQRRSFLGDEYLFWLFGNDRIRLVLVSDPCYQTQYGGSNAFLLYRSGGRVTVTQVLNGFFSRADNPLTMAWAKLNNEQIVEVATWSGGLNPTLTNYYFVVHPKTGHAAPKNLFKGDHGPTNEITSALPLNNNSAALKIVRGQTLARSFILYVDDPNGKIDGNGRTLSRRILHWNGRIYR